MRRKTTRRDLYIKLAKEGLPISDIADKCGVSKQAVHSALWIAKEKGIDVSYNKKLVPIDDDTKNAILELYNQYNTIKDIANITGVSAGTVSKIIKDARKKGLLDRPFKSHSNIYSTIVELINEGYSSKEISDKLDCPIRRVYNYISKAKKDGVLIDYDNRVDVRKSDCFYDDVVKLYNAGYVCKEIIKELNISSNTLYKILSDAEKNSDIIFRKSNKKSDKSKYYKFIELYNKGCSRREIGKELDVQPSTASRYLSKAKKENPELLTRDTIRYHQDIINKVVDLYNKDYKYSDIANELGLAINTVAYLISEAKFNQPESFTRRSPVVNNKPKYRVYAEKINEGYSISETAALFNVSRQAVSELLKIAEVNGVFVNRKHLRSATIAESDKEEIIRLYNTSVPITEISKSVGIHEYKVREFIKLAKADNLIRDNDISNERYTDAINMLNEGYSTKYIANKLNVSKSAVYYYIRKGKDNNALINYSLKKGTPRKIIDYDKLMDMYYKGYTLSEMGKELSSSDITIRKVLLEHGVSTSRYRACSIHNQRYMKYIELYNSGYSMKDMAKEIGVSTNTLKNYLEKAKSENKITMRCKKYN